MTLINAKLYKSGTTTPLVGYITVQSNAPLYATDKSYVNSPVTFPLVNGETVIDVIATDILKISYNFKVYETVVGTDAGDNLLQSFDAVIPSSVTALNFNTLAPQLGIRFDLRDSSLLTLARYLVNADPFLNFLGSKLWSNKGTWVSTTVYRRGDVVLRNGSSYQYVDNSQAANLLPENNPTKWSLLVSGSGGGSAALPIGSMTLYPAALNAPASYLKCDGTTVSRTTYAALFSVVGTTYGAGNGTTTFTLPDSAITGLSRFIIYAGV
jgi:hypothetical protein